MSASPPSPTTAQLTDLAWLGEHAAARLPRTLHLHAERPLAVTVGAEIGRLRTLADGAEGTLILWDRECAGRAAVPPAGLTTAVLDELADAGEEAYALRTDGERLTVLAGERLEVTGQRMHGHVAGQGKPSSAPVIAV